MALSTEVTNILQRNLSNLDVKMLQDLVDLRVQVYSLTSELGAWGSTREAQMHLKETDLLRSAIRSALSSASQ